MILTYAGGVPFHAEFSSADASAPANETAARMTLYGAGAKVALALNANDIVHITDLSVSCGGTNLTVNVWDGADATIDAGELAWKGIVPTNSTLSPAFQVAHACQMGTYPKVKTSGAGQVDVVAKGFIVRAGS